ncbi:hypothetical protein BS47DRAFT_1329427 [Hydnum rufescens UP504]|uniref:RRM domain-containing protein n=1 Tax=Hydnum rufescens UP504 TaxID=1448309 RepID=A0A9P6AZD8_9AGAM|nr:hypothetical protein BS47DRAFT_1329427 [Hydnum rufescens UP504]
MQSQKLTKKQKKAIAFRERKGKVSGVPLDIPEIDLPDVSDPPVIESTPQNKRKRDNSDLTEPTTKRARKDEVTTPPADKPEKKKQRYILFVGNLSYTSTRESIQIHFEACPDPPIVRLLTPKASKSGAAAKSKGCAFLEFPNARSLQVALKLHHSQLDERMINVELTSGGGGGGENRRETLKARNKALEEEREKVPKGLKGTPAERGQQPSSGLPTRHSMTSGADHKPATIKTWSVPSGVEEPGRGGKNAKPKTRGPKKSQKKAWASGANAVAVG